MIVQCPDCGRIFRHELIVQDGEMVKCPKCGEWVVIHIYFTRAAEE
jgi:predicted Zn finger-like uncharacterized protein